MSPIACSSTCCMWIYVQLLNTTVHQQNKNLQKYQCQTFKSKDVLVGY